MRRAQRCPVVHSALLRSVSWRDAPRLQISVYSQLFRGLHRLEATSAAEAALLTACTWELFTNPRVRTQSQIPGPQAPKGPSYPSSRPHQNTFVHSSPVRPPNAAAVDSPCIGISLLCADVQAATHQRVWVHVMNRVSILPHHKLMGGQAHQHCLALWCVCGSDDEARGSQVVLALRNALLLRFACS